ncbi:interleukin-1 alpha [Notamacropus eugenii]|uniref:interleukin-1 alpha n=1 Tax=Notamacropus eugenii TaxID=9315 RepID=UPI003B66B2F7
MARVPDMYDELHYSYGENEEFLLDIDQVSLSQEFFYPSSNPHHKENLKRLETSEKTQQFNFQRYGAAPTAQKKTVKRQLSMSHPINNDSLVNNVNISEEDKDVMKTESDSLPVRKKIVYHFQAFDINQILTDQNSRRIRQKQNNLRVVSYQGSLPDLLFDIGKYVTLEPAPNNRIAVTLRLSNTSLYVTAKKEKEAVQLEEIPETPIQIDGSNSPHLFYWTEDVFSTFASVANPDLFLAADERENKPMFMARGPPALINFLVEAA